MVDERTMDDDNTFYYHYDYRRLDDPMLHRTLAWSILCLSPVVALLLTTLGSKISTYGKLHKTQQNSYWSWGPLISAKLAWILFESPNWIWVIFEVSVLVGRTRKATMNDSPPPSPLSVHQWILLGWFFWHYLYRSIYYPLQMSSASKFPIGMMIFTVPYCTVNGYLQAAGICRFVMGGGGGDDDDDDTTNTILRQICFSLGMMITVTGFAVGVHSDHILLRLRRCYSGGSGGSGGGNAYQIPFGGMFRYVSCPHYFGEILEWTGYCLASSSGGACWWSWSESSSSSSLAALSFVLWTASNLIPRGRTTHQWYHTKFAEEYPALHRQAVIPFLL